MSRELSYQHMHSTHRDATRPLLGAHGLPSQVETSERHQNNKIRRTGENKETTVGSRFPVQQHFALSINRSLPQPFLPPFIFQGERVTCYIMWLLLTASLAIPLDPNDIQILKCILTWSSYPSPKIFRSIYYSRVYVQATSHAPLVHFSIEAGFPHDNIVVAFGSGS